MGSTAGQWLALIQCCGRQTPQACLPAVRGLLAARLAASLGRSGAAGLLAHYAATSEVHVGNFSLCAAAGIAGARALSILGPLLGAAPLRSSLASGTL